MLVTGCVEGPAAGPPVPIMQKSDRNLEEKQITLGRRLGIPSDEKLDHRINIRFVLMTNNPVFHLILPIQVLNISNIAKLPVPAVALQ
jgi:hypothetical protein